MADTDASLTRSDSDYADGYAAGYNAAVRDIQWEFQPLWGAVQGALAASHRLDAFIVNLRRETDVG